MKYMVSWLVTETIQFSTNKKNNEEEYSESRKQSNCKSKFRRGVT